MKNENVKTINILTTFLGAVNSDFLQEEDYKKIRSKVTEWDKELPHSLN